MRILNHLVKSGYLLDVRFSTVPGRSAQGKDIKYEQLTLIFPDGQAISISPSHSSNPDYSRRELSITTHAFDPKSIEKKNK